MKKLILAEKPSVAKNIADATGAVRRNGYYEGESYLITWAFGHLLQLYDARDYDPAMKVWRMEKFPFIPQVFQYKLKSDGKNKDKPDAGVVRQMEIIRSLMQRPDVTGIISATDDDREGQIIADEVWGYLKPGKPVERILLNEWTADEVNRGLNNLRPNEAMQSLQDAGFGRQIADWLIGINLTSVATLKAKHGKNSKLLNVGRVLMPTLKIIYDRDKEIEDFKVTRYYKLRAFFKPGSKRQFEGTYYIDKNEKFDSPDELKELADRIQGYPAQITSKKVTQKKEYAPYLFNLSNLQGHVTSKFKGWTSDKVLKVAQDLYEKKYITYPRTSSVVLDESLKGKTAKVLEIHRQQSPYADQIKFHTSKRVFDSKKVESHSAIIPTYMLPKSLSEDERIVYEAIRNRFLAQFMPVAVAEDTELILKVLDPEKTDRSQIQSAQTIPVQEELIHSAQTIPVQGADNPKKILKSQFLDISGYFQAKGKVQLVEGWKLIEGIDSKDVTLPAVEKGEIAEIKKTEVKEVERKPPKPHTEKTLLKVMETCGKKYEEKDDQEMMMAILSGFSIGTPATRAETIKKLKTAGYIKARGKSLTCTDLGRQMVETFPARELFDLEYTGRLEKTLSDIEKQKHSRQEFLDLITDFVRTSVDKIKQDPVFGGTKDSPPLHTEPVGICPECGAPVMETDKAFGCSNWRNGCHFTIWKNDYFINSLGKKVTYDMVKILLEHGKVGFHGCVSKKGNKFSAYFFYEKDEKTGKYRWRLEFI
ncbi:MAG: type IA DNA topoisomerase [Eubacterium sp.]|nr:type IA DNA topoisomerase [Eubacterium sp.]